MSALELPTVEMRVETLAVRVGGSRRRDRERLLATPGFNQADQERNLSARYVRTMGLWLERAVRRRPERIVTVRPATFDRAEVGDDFLSNRYHLLAQVDCVLPPPGLLEGVTHYELRKGVHVLSAVQPPDTHRDRHGAVSRRQ